MFFQDFFWFLLWSFYFIAYLYIVIVVIMDLFRDDKLNGWFKALWIIALVFVPFLTGLIYVIARGKGMAQRAQAARGGIVAESDDYRPAASASPADDIAKAKALLDAGTISQGEYDALKSKALGNQYFGA
ncbi:SHOCT domain-containing protein [Microbacterium kyungheense]|uniref:Phospholipase D-like protein n=1 Tax=Microbacterium kyungheense TaxID=1263636 RepID=A0A543F3D8_9MICO|nr:SHOCT domain-containing protein [Microbacterium kyungheense]TQM28339.1 phospholipase D-like protein [Microbacterium kyungheense]